MPAAKKYNVTQYPYVSPEVVVPLCVLKNSSEILTFSEQQRFNSFQGDLAVFRMPVSRTLREEEGSNVLPGSV
jgi:hypothetical protein